MSTETTAPNIPKFLYGEDALGEREFVIHLERPRFIVEFENDQSKEVIFLDPVDPYIDALIKGGQEPAMAIARLMRQAGDFYVEYLRNLYQE
jgi:hypothetical protein